MHTIIVAYVLFLTAYGITLTSIFKSFRASVSFLSKTTTHKKNKIKTLIEYVVNCSYVNTFFKLTSTLCASLLACNAMFRKPDSIFLVVRLGQNICNKVRHSFLFHYPSALAVKVTYGVPKIILVQK